MGLQWFWSRPLVDALRFFPGTKKKFLLLMILLLVFFFFFCLVLNFLHVSYSCDLWFICKTTNVLLYMFHIVFVCLFCYSIWLVHIHIVQALFSTRKETYNSCRGFLCCFLFLFTCLSNFFLSLFLFIFIYLLSSFWKGGGEQRKGFGSAQNTHARSASVLRNSLFLLATNKRDPVRIIWRLFKALGHSLWPVGQIR